MYITFKAQWHNKFETFQRKRRFYDTAHEEKRNVSVIRAKEESFKCFMLSMKAFCSCVILHNIAQT